MRHRACAVGRAYRQLVYHPDRLLYPLKRTGARGSGEFARISWDEALETVANELKRVKDTYGNGAILHFCSLVDAYTVHHIQAYHSLLCMFGGYTAPWGSISAEALLFAAATLFGGPMARRTGKDFDKGRLIILWGWDPASARHGTEFNLGLLQAKENGAKFVVVDPRYCDSAAVYADQWIPLRPCTDTAVLAAMAYVIVTENLHDKVFIDKYVFGFEKWCDYLLGVEDGVKKTPEWAEAISGVPAATIADLAREYARVKPALLLEGYAPGRTAFGEQFHRAIWALCAITGNASLPAQVDMKSLKARFKATHTPSPPNPVERDAPPRWNALPGRGTSVNSSARVNVNSFADAVMKGKSGGYAHDYKFLWFTNTNYVNQLGDVNRTVEAFKKLDFILVNDQFMTPTARIADIIFPVCTYMERNDLQAPGYVQGVPDFYASITKAIEPLGESKSPLDICDALALKLGIADYNDKTDEEWVRYKLAQLSKVMDCPDYDTLRKQGVFFPKEDKQASAGKNAADQPEQPKFFTRSGKIEIYSQLIADMNNPLLPPIPKYIETWESLNDPLAAKYPLQIVSYQYKFRIHSQGDNVPWLRALQSNALSVSSEDARQRGISNGDLVRVFNDRGEMIIPCRVTERIKPGVVAIPEGAWFSPDGDGVDLRGSANTVTSGMTSPGGAFTDNTALVQVEKVE
jgi:anaerobic dimethyl sulfoxide reductase subunit A